MKTLLNIAIAASLGFAACAQAQTITLQKAANGSIIHELFFESASGAESLTLSGKLSVGNLKSGQCTYATSFDMQPESYSTKETYGLEGDVLANILGVGFDCMKFEFTHNSQTVADAFTLKNDGHVYTSTTPNQAHLKFN